MFRRLRFAPSRVFRPVQPVRTPLFRQSFVRNYSPNVEKPPKDAKLRYFVLIALIATGAFAVGIRGKQGSRRQGEMSEEEYEKIKEKSKQLARAFSPDDVFVVFVLGGPGSGKGTQCANIVRDYDFVHLSAGDLLRAEQKREGSTYGKLIADYIKAGQIVPQEITVALLRNAMQENVDKGIHHFLIDGFPRKMDQALTFENTIVPSKFTLFFDCPESTMLERLLDRGKTSGRADDNLESIKKRFKVFETESMPVVHYFDLVDKTAKLSCLDTPDNVYKHVQAVLAKHGVTPK